MLRSSPQSSNLQFGDKWHGQGFTAKEPVMATKWEYQVVIFEPTDETFNTGELERQLNVLGEKGWELASMIEHESGERIADFTLVLKRPKR
jgi:hypothetical protein